MGIGTATSNLVTGLIRLVGPVVMLCVAYGAAFVLMATPITVLDPFLEGAPGTWLTGGHLAIMVAFFLSMLSNRARGPAFAFAALVAAWVLIGAGVIYLAAHPIAQIPSPDVAALRAGTPLLAALFSAHVVNILAFDAMRGIPWWRAPLFGGAIAAIALPAAYWLIAKSGDVMWLNRMTLDIALKATTVLLLLIPFAMLRSATRPRNGFGGY